MKKNFSLTNMLSYQNLDPFRIPSIAGALVHRLYIDEPVPKDKSVNIVDEKEVSLGVAPDGPIIKMWNKKHVDGFFETGIIQLGNFDYYNKFDHEEIGDKNEGSFLLVGRRPPTTIFATVHGGYNRHIFCCFSGEADAACLERFGYDSGFIIHDVNGFSKAIQANLSASGFSYAKCVYSKDKVISGKIPDGMDLNVISQEYLNLVGDSKFFIKPDIYSHQSEFRFIWNVPENVYEPTIINCPDARHFCERIN